LNVIKWKKECSPEPIGTIGREARTKQRGQACRAHKGRPLSCPDFRREKI